VYDASVDELSNAASATSLFGNLLAATNTEGIAAAAAVNTLNNIFNNVVAEVVAAASVQSPQAAFVASIAFTASAQAAQTVIAAVTASQAEGATSLDTPMAYCQQNKHR
jgi:hypothetical protein